MLALRTASRISPLLSNGFNRYACRTFDCPGAGFHEDLLSRRLLIGRSLTVQAFDIYRSFFLYNSVAPYKQPSLKYWDGAFARDAPSSWDSFLSGIWKCCLDIGVWFIQSVQSYVGWIFPSVGPQKLVLKLERREESDDTCSSEDGDSVYGADCSSEKLSIAARSWELVDDSLGN